MQKVFQFENLGSVSEYHMPLVLISLAFKFFDLMALALTPIFGDSFESLSWFLALVSIHSSYLDSFFQHKDSDQPPEIGYLFMFQRELRHLPSEQL